MAGTSRKIKAKDMSTVATALAYAIEALDMLPPGAQGSEKAAMIRLLSEIAPNAETKRLLARARLEGRRVDVTDGYLELAG